MKKIKIMTISDVPLAPSGIGSQTNYLIRSMLKTGKFQFVSLGGAMHHERMDPFTIDEFGNDWLIIPVKDYGDQDTVRSIIRHHRPDILWYMTDPRFYFWLFQIENEIRPLVPMVYYHVWDNLPMPKYNDAIYNSNDVIVSISKLTANIVETVAPNVKHLRIPHAVPKELFKKLPEDELMMWRHEHMPWARNKFLFFWNNRNARRKQSGTLVWWFKEFLDRVGHDKACLLMHTNPKDPMGQDLELIAHDLGLDQDGKFFISNQAVNPEVLGLMYNAADCVINISDAEGFGLATLEALMCETPILVNLTGGLKEQVFDEKTNEWFGVGIEPKARAIIGSPETPYIYEDRIVKEDFLDAMEKMMNSSKEQRRTWGKNGRAYLDRDYNFEKVMKQWEELFLWIYETHGSWENRKLQHPLWELKEI